MIVWIGFCVMLVNIVDKILLIFCGVFLEICFCKVIGIVKIELMIIVINVERNVLFKYKNKIGLI